MNQEVAHMGEKLEPSKLSVAMLGNTNGLRHGHSRSNDGNYTPTYVSWVEMRQRCKRTDRHNSASYADVRVCDRWHVFENFLADMGERPDGTTLDRFPNRDGDYEPGNCRWATATEQARNRKNARLTFDGAVEVALAMLRGERASSVAARFGCSESLPREIAKGRTWKDALIKARAAMGGQS